MLIRLLVVSVVLFISQCSAQSWETGDNSTVKGCSTHCSVVDKDLSCWNKTRDFFEKTLIGHLRHYIAVQVDIDQWHRRHGMKDGQDMKKLREDSIARMLAILHDNEVEEDVLTEEVVKSVGGLLVDRVEKFSDHLIAWVPHFQCPTPCEYRNTMYLSLAIASMILNVCLVCSVVPFLRRMLKSDNVGDGLLSSTRE